MCTLAPGAQALPHRVTKRLAVGLVHQVDHVLQAVPQRLGRRFSDQLLAGFVDVDDLAFSVGRHDALAQRIERLPGGTGPATVRRSCIGSSTHLNRRHQQRALALVARGLERELETLAGAVGRA